jgi:hypothetical protein
MFVASDARKLDITTSPVLTEPSAFTVCQKVTRQKSVLKRPYASSVTNGAILSTSVLHLKDHTVKIAKENIKVHVTF